MTQVGEGVAVGVVVAAVEPCDHAWEETESKSPEEGKKANSETAAKVKVSDPPSAKGYEFENHCIDANMEKMKISKVSVQYKCSKCSQDQEVDIVGENQIAECKNKKKADLKQAERLRDIQTKTKGEASHWQRSTRITRRPAASRRLTGKTASRPKWWRVFRGEAGGTMTIAFTQYSAGPRVDLVDAGQALSVALANLGFQAREGIVAVHHDPEDDSFEDGHSLLVAPMDLLLASPAAGVLASETGFRIEFINASLGLTVTVRIVNHGNGAVSLLEMQDRAFYRFVKQAPARSVVRLLAAGAICIHAEMGFGAFEIEWESFSEDQILGFIVKGPPGYEGRPPPFGVIEIERFLSNLPLASRIGALFDVYREQAYTVLVRKGALELFASL